MSLVPCMYNDVISAMYNDFISTMCNDVISTMYNDVISTMYNDVISTMYNIVIQAELTPTTLPLVQISRRPQLLFFTKDLQSKAFNEIERLSKDLSLKNKFGFNYLPL